MSILAQFLEPCHILALVSINLVSHATARQIVFILTNRRSLIAISVEIVGTLTAAITPQRVGTVHANHIACIVAVGNLTTIIAYPAAKCC